MQFSRCLRTPHLSGGLAEGFHLFPFRTQKLSLHTPMVLDWKRSGRVGSRRDPTNKAPAFAGALFCWYTCDYLLPRTCPDKARSALDLQHDEAERPLCGMKRGEGMASKGAVGVGFSPDAPRLLRCLPGRAGSR